MPARLGVISDTHLPTPSGLPPLLLTAFEGVDAILHGGDVTDLTCLRPLTAVAPVYVVAGNNDPPEMGLQYGWRRALRWRGWRIGVVHGDVGRGRTTPDRAMNAFSDSPPRWEEVAERTARLTPLPSSHVPTPPGRPHAEQLDGQGEGPFDLIIFGHSHIPHCENRRGTLLINPGSPTDRRREPRASFVVMEEDAGVLTARFIYL